MKGEPAMKRNAIITVLITVFLTLSYLQPSDACTRVLYETGTMGYTTTTT